MEMYFIQQKKNSCLPSEYFSQILQILPLKFEKNVLLKPKIKFENLRILSSDDNLSTVGVL